MPEILAQAWSNIRANKIRSILTMFGICWGVISILLLSAISEGFQQGNQAIFQEFGKNIIVIEGGATSMQAGGARAGHKIRLSLKDVASLQSNSRLLQFISPEIINRVTAKSAYNAGAFQISGIWPIYQQLRALELQRGEPIKEFDEKIARRSLIIGADACQLLFADRDPIGDQVMLNGLPYTIIGKMKKKSQESNYDGMDNDRLFIPLASMRRDFPLSENLDDSEAISAIIAAPHENMIDELNRRQEEEGAASIFTSNGPIEAEIRAILAPQHNFDAVDQEALSIWNTNAESVMFNKIIKGMRRFFGVVSFITLALGGLGIMNIMLIAVKERTHEIGVRKAVGATAINIQCQFFSEGLCLTLLSGLSGLVFGIGICKLINLFPMPERFAGMIVTVPAAALAIAILALIGVASASYPAYCAAHLPPVEALRRES
jgi:putative ABC transport system permease protein